MIRAMPWIRQGGSPGELPPNLDFLRPLPEFHKFRLGQDEATIQAIVTQNSLKITGTAQDGFAVTRQDGENLRLSMRDGKCSGIQRVVLLVGHLGETIQQRFQDGAELGIRIDYSFDRPVLLGTAGAIHQALPLLPERFFVLYGDSYLPCDYAAVEAALRNSGLPGLMTELK